MLPQSVEGVCLGLVAQKPSMRVGIMGFPYMYFSPVMFRGGGGKSWACRDIDGSLT